MRLLCLVAVLLVPWFVGCTLATDGGSLSEGCPEGTKNCGGVCVSIVDHRFGCGRASCAACALQNSVTGCDAEGECIVASCVGSWEDCDRDPENGCEVHLDTQVENCGACGDACRSPEHGSPGCAEAQCYVRYCEEPYSDCNFEYRDGCEVDLSSDEDNCGDCDVRCNTDEECVAGECAAAE